jgi:hypothetical protein
MIGKKDFTQEKRSPALFLDLYNAMYQIGGVSPTFDPAKWKQLLNVISYVGCMKNILINNSPYDPLSGNYFGVESSCSAKVRDFKYKLKVSYTLSCNFCILYRRFTSQVLKEMDSQSLNHSRWRKTLSLDCLSRLLLRLVSYCSLQAVPNRWVS